jgi:hypothetical protein
MAGDIELGPAERAAEDALRRELEAIELPPGVVPEHILAALRAQRGPGPELAELARPFPTEFVERKDGQDYVAHHVVNQRLLSIVGPFDFELVQVIRGDVAAVPPDASARSRRGKAGTPELRNIVVGGIWRLRATIDGRPVQVEEVGDVGDVNNWPHDGARLKDAASDALKRCSMRVGLGLHLWAQEHYFLDQQLRAQRDRG